MQITILTLGSRGDVQPYVALGLGLQAAGFGVRVATHGIFREFVESYGLDFFSLAGDPHEMMASPDGRSWLDSGNNPIKFTRHFIRLTKPRVQQTMADSWAACQGSDAIIFSLLGIAGYHAAEKLGVPALVSFLQPFGRTHSYPSIGMPIQLNLGRWYNWFTHVVTEQVFWQPFRSLVNEWRRETLRLPPMPFWGPYQRLTQFQQPILYGYSPVVAPPPRDWPGWLRVTGYWFLDQPPGWQPPHDLVDFLEAGPAPVYVGFGSMTDGKPEALLEMVLAAVAKTRQRAVLLSGWAGLSRTDLPDEVFALSSIPHDWLFPRTAAVIHHGGAGTTAAGLRAGVPNIVVPFFGDQHFWAQRVTALGAGPKSIPRQKLSAERLAAAIETAVNDPAVRARAAAVGHCLRAEDGVGAAVAVIERHLETCGDGSMPRATWRRERRSSVLKLRSRIRSRRDNWRNSGRLDDFSGGEVALNLYDQADAVSGEYDPQVRF